MHTTVGGWVGTSPILCTSFDNNLIFAALFSSRFLRELVKVDLSHNGITTVSPGAFASQRSLKQLKLEGNKIAKVDAETFRGLKTLEVREQEPFRSALPLFSRRNVLYFACQSVYTSLLKKCGKVYPPKKKCILNMKSEYGKFGGFFLESLWLMPFSNTGSRLKTYEYLRFFFLLRQVLILRGNILESVSAGTFRAMGGSLRELDLSKNRIATIEEGAFKGEGEEKGDKLIGGLRRSKGGGEG